MGFWGFGAPIVMMWRMSEIVNTNSLSSSHWLEDDERWRRHEHFHTSEHSLHQRHICDDDDDDDDDDDKGWWCEAKDEECSDDDEEGIFMTFASIHFHRMPCRSHARASFGLVVLVLFVVVCCVFPHCSLCLLVVCFHFLLSLLVFVTVRVCVCATVRIRAWARMSCVVWTSASSSLGWWWPKTRPLWMILMIEYSMRVLQYHHLDLSQRS